MVSLHRRVAQGADPVGALRHAQLERLAASRAVYGDGQPGSWGASSPSDVPDQRRRTRVKYQIRP